jgi:hypothetical protein
VAPDCTAPPLASQAAGAPPLPFPPFVLWARADLAAIRRRVETRAWAKRKCGELPKGNERGAATFYPPDSRVEKGYVTQPGDKPTGFTYCKEQAFVALVEAWRRDIPTGVARKVEIDAYNGAFMPHLEKP